MRAGATRQSRARTAPRAKAAWRRARAHLERRSERAQLAVGAVAQPRLLCGDGDRAVDAVKDDGGADARADDDAAVDALGDLHLLARVEHVDRRLLAALDLDVDAHAGVLGEARARRLEEGRVGEELALDALARARALPAERERLFLFRIHCVRL